MSQEGGGRLGVRWIEGDGIERGIVREAYEGEEGRGCLKDKAFPFLKFNHNFALVFPLILIHLILTFSPLVRLALWFSVFLDHLYVDMLLTPTSIRKKLQCYVVGNQTPMLMDRNNVNVFYHLSDWSLSQFIAQAIDICRDLSLRNSEIFLYL
ncbi:unnamed protein product [Citrullus colocynthis]|uniref:Uncharacterized protein n=1 Tax=Citrullus colocynthis TaxID=252529 RepID=A0ABP0YTR3_9ROSI